MKEHDKVKYIFEHRLHDMKLDAYLYELIDHYEITVYDEIAETHEGPATYRKFNVNKWFSSNQNFQEIAEEIFNIFKRENPEVFL